MNENDQNLSNLIKTYLQGQRVFQQLIDDVSSTFTASTLQFETLNYIFEQESPTMKAIANNLSISLPSCSQLAERMVKAKLVERVYNKKDRRVVKLQLTAMGKLELKRMIMYLNGKIKEVFKDLSVSETEAYLKINNKLFENISKLQNI